MFSSLKNKQNKSNSQRKKSKKWENKTESILEVEIDVNNAEVTLVNTLGDSDTPLGDFDTVLGDSDTPLGVFDAVLGDSDTPLGDFDAVLGDSDTVLDGSDSDSDSDAVLGDSDAVLDGSNSDVVLFDSDTVLDGSDSDAVLGDSDIVLGDSDVSLAKTENIIIQYDGISEGFFVGWVSANVNNIQVFIEGAQVAEGLCNQSREDVKQELGIEAKGFKILFDGNSLNYNWLSLDKAKLSVVVDNDASKEKIHDVDILQLIDEVCFYNKKPLIELIDIVKGSSFWNEGYYKLQLSENRYVLTDLVKDYILFGGKLNIDPSVYFCSEFYLNNPEAQVSSDENPLIHYLTIGMHNQYKPNASFDIKLNKTLGIDESLGYCEYSIIGSKYVMLVGWHISDEELTQVGISHQSNNKLKFESNKIIRTKRVDVAKAFPEKNVRDFSGFIALVEISQDTIFDINKELFLNLWDRKGTIEVRTEVSYLALDNKNINCARILNNWDPKLTEHQRLAGETILPMIQELYPINNKVSSVRNNYGEIEVNPSATIIIPLYGRFDFMRYQISNFARYNCMNDVEVIYIVDDPNIRDEVLKLATELYKTFNFKFSVVLLENNVGFGRANNIAAEYANSENLILLNSDVLPKSGDWAKNLITHLDGLPNAGIVGARLLFEDESIQHDGMSPMLLDQYPSLIFNDHPRKGWPLSLSNNEASPQECPLVTAACIAIKKSLFDELNGFDPAYILGDFEDSDLCLRALAKNKINYICRDITLNHLERLSQNLVESGDWKHKLTLLNANTYNQRWANNLKKLFPHELKEFKNA